MDKETGIVVGVIGAVIVALLAVVFVMDSKVEEPPRDIIATVNGKEFSVDNFKKYLKLKYYESGDTVIKPSQTDVSTLLDEYILEKIYYTKALEKGVIIEEEINYEDEYIEKEKPLLALGITLEDYVSIKKESALVEELQHHFSDYYEIPSATYQAVIDDYKEKDLYNTFSFRVMQIPYTVPEESSGEEQSGEILETEASGEEAEQEEATDTSKETQKALAEEVLAKLREAEDSGETFEELSKEYGSYRFTFVGNGYSLVNGDLEHATGPVLKSKLGGDDEIYNAFMALNPGEYTDIIDVDTYHAFQIIKMESREDGFVGEGEQELKDLLLSELMENMVVSDSNYRINDAGYISALYE